MSQKREQEFKISDITDKIPFTCRFITASVFFIWLADIFIHIISYLANDANLTWTPSYQIWRLFTASFCISSLLTLFIAGINCYTFLPKLELRIGSINLLLQFFVTGFVIQIIYTILYLLLPESIQNLTAIGDFSGVWFSLIFKYCYYNNNTKIKLCCFPLKISKLVYPFILLGILSLLQLHIKLDCIIGILIGFVQIKIFKGGNIFELESDICLVFLSNFKSWIKSQSIIGNKYCYQSLQQQIQVQKWSTSTKQSKQDYFRNKKGFRLGDSS